MTWLRAWLHVRRTGHLMQVQVITWSGDSARVYLCECGKEFWPVSKQGPYLDWRDNPVDRRRG